MMAERAAALQAQQVAMGMAAQPPAATPAPMYAPAPAGTTAAPMTFQQRFGASATVYQKYDAGGVFERDAAAGAGLFSAANANMWACKIDHTRSRYETNEFGLFRGL